MMKKFLIMMSCSFLFLVSCGKSSVSELRLQGIDQLEKGKYEEARQSFEEALSAGKGKISKEQYDILKYRAETEYMLGEYDQAKETLDILVKIDGDREEYRKILEQVEAKLLVQQASDALNDNDTDQARELLDQAKSAGLQNDKDYLFNEIVYLEKTAKWQEAYDALSSYLENYQGDSEAEREMEFLSSRIEALHNNSLLNEAQNANSDMGDITETQ